ncbi:MAG: hypothetical protein GYA21_10445 [Myxococcales bacterium]|nr:hypothetical protein [Myxococcales bacterium]
MRWIAVWMLMMLFGAGSGCAGSDGSPDVAGEEHRDGGDGGADAGGDGGGCGTDCPPVDPELLPGTYAMLQVNARITNVPVVGQTHTETHALLRATVTRGGADRLDMLIQVCDLKQVSETTLVQVVFPEAFLQSLETYPRVIELRPDLGTNRFVSPLAVEVYGAHLVDPVNDTLPAEAADSRVYDQDGDGKPGVTIRVTGLVDGEIYLVQRSKSTLSGWFESPDRWGGLIDSEVEQVYLGSDNPVLSKPNESTKDPDPSHSTIVLKRIEPLHECDWISSQGEALFP